MLAGKIRPVRRACAFYFYMGILYESFSDGINIKNPANRIAAPFAGHSAQNLIGDDHALVLCVKAAQTAAGHNIHPRIRDVTDTLYLCHRNWQISIFSRWISSNL